MASWKRPENVPYPSIWRTFEGKHEVNGIKSKYWVQDLTPEYKDQFLRLMTTGFLKDEVLSKYSNAINDEQSVQEFAEMWKDLMEDKSAIICLTKNSKSQIQLVGGYMTTVACKDQHSDINPFKSKLCKKIISTLDYVSQVKDVYTELGVNEYLTDMGLFVLPEFRGQGIAVEILKATRELCLAVGLKVSGATFTSAISQKAAVSAGFKDFVTETYEELAKKNSDFDYPGISQSSKYIKFMYNRYD